MGCSHNNQGDYDQAIEAHQQAAGVAQSIDYRFALTDAHRSMCEIHLKNDNIVAARQDIHAAVTVGETSGNRLLMLAVLAAATGVLVADSRSSVAADMACTIQEATDEGLILQMLEPHIATLDTSTASEDAGNDGQAALSIDNLDQQVVLDNTGTLAEEETFENFAINYPSNWYGSQDGLDITISNSQQAEANHGAILAGTQDIAEDVILIQAQSQASLVYGGFQVGDATTAEGLLTDYLAFLQMALAAELTGDPVPYEEIALPAYRFVATDAVDELFPAGTVLVAVEYANGLALYQVVFDGGIRTFEPIAREIISNATIDG